MIFSGAQFVAMKGKSSVPVKYLMDFSLALAY